MASATPRTVQLRRYGRQRIKEFLKEDAVDEETRDKAGKLLSALSSQTA